MIYRCGCSRKGQKILKKKIKAIKVYQKGINYGIYFVLLFLLLYFQKSILQDILDLYTLRFQTENTEGINIEQFIQLMDEDAMDYGFNCEIKSETGRQDCNVKKVLVNEVYMKSFPYQLLKGQILDSFMVKNRERVAMIDYDLALKLFFSSDVLGRHIFLDGIDYKIIGVYEDKSISFAKDQYTRVFIPYGSVDGWESFRIDTISISRSGDWKEKLEKLRIEMGNTFDKYLYEDIGESKRLVHQGGKFLNFFLGINIIVLFLKLFIRMIKEVYMEIMKSLKEKYLYEVMKQYYLKIIKIIFFSAIVLSVIVLLWKLLHFKVIIPTDFIPDENIFDVSYYWNVLLQSAKLYNSSILAGSGNMHRSLFYCHILNVVIIFIGFCYIYKICQDDKILGLSYNILVWFSILEIVVFHIILMISISKIIITMILMIFLLVLKRIENGW